MKLLGIDYGLKRVGVAFSDDNATLAFPLSVISTEKVTEEVLKIIEEKGIDKIVIGESKNYDQQYNPIMKDVNDFVDELKGKTDIEIVLHPEFMSSAQVSREIHYSKTPREQKVRGEKRQDVDAQAATIILQSYIDSKKL